MAPVEIKDLDFDELHRNFLDRRSIEELRVLSNKNRTFPCCDQHLASLRRTLETKKEKVLHPDKTF